MITRLGGSRKWTCQNNLTRILTTRHYFASNTRNSILVSPIVFLYFNWNHQKFKWRTEFDQKRNRPHDASYSAVAHHLHLMAAVVLAAAVGCWAYHPSCRWLYSSNMKECPSLLWFDSMRPTEMGKRISKFDFTVRRVLSKFMPFLSLLLLPASAD